MPKVNGTPARALTLTPASEIRLRPVRWLWTDRIALGTLCLLGGREGVGKSLLAYTLAAQMTKGVLPGVYAGTPKAVIVAASEDSWEHTIGPRLTAAGADLTRVYRINVHTLDGNLTGLSLPVDLLELKRVVTMADAGLIVFDPLLSRLDTALDTHKDADVRVALEPVVTLADETGAAVIGLIHVNKSASNDPLTLLMGSRAFAAVARAVLFVMPDADDKTKRLLGQVKNNLGRTDLPTLSFRINGVHLTDTDEGEVWTGQIEWLADSARSIHETIAATSSSDEDRSTVNEAVDWLGDYLTSCDGPVESAIAKRTGAKAGHASRTLQRACTLLHVVTTATGFPRKTYWRLPTLDDERARAGSRGFGATAGATDSETF